MRHGVYFEEADCDLPSFQELISRKLSKDSVPLADEVERNIPIYDMDRLRDVLNTEMRQELMAEWAAVFSAHSGIVVLKAAYGDTDCIDAASEVYRKIIDEERTSSSGGDHFAAAGANDRVWNSLQKLCLRAPDVFLPYFANDPIAAVCEAWLGPWYQMTAQVNQVRPGGKAQTVHRDYHLGFQSSADVSRFPIQAHQISPLLTLQGAIAHVDMEIESGHTKLLPYSHLFEAGYLAYHNPEFGQVFEDNFVQLPLKKGDAIFFNPAVFHAAGENKSNNVNRLVNLLQISSAMGRATEAVDRVAMCKALYPSVLRAWSDDGLSEAELDAVIAASAAGYSFPTNLDSDPPLGGMVPQSQASLIKDSIKRQMPYEAFLEALSAQVERRSA